MQRVRAGLDGRQRFRYLQHFQASQSSEGSILDAADVVFIQLPAEHTGERGEALLHKTQSLCLPAE